MKMHSVLIGFVIGMFVGVAGATTVETKNIHITKDGVVTYLNQACAD